MEENQHFCQHIAVKLRCVSGEMATEVETLLPNNALLKQDEQEKRCQGDADGASEPVMKEQSVEENDSQPKENLSREYPAESEEREKADKKEFTAAPPPKVNPWTKKMDTVSSVNGQTQHGVYTISLYYMNIHNGMSKASTRTPFNSVCKFHSRVRTVSLFRACQGCLNCHLNCICMNSTDILMHSSRTLYDRECKALNAPLVCLRPCVSFSATCL